MILAIDTTERAILIFSHLFTQQHDGRCWAVMLAGKLGKKINRSQSGHHYKIAGLYHRFRYFLLYTVRFRRLHHGVCFILACDNLYVFFLIPWYACGQTLYWFFLTTDVTIKDFETVCPWVPTVHDQWLGGTITAVRNASLFRIHIPFHVHELGCHPSGLTTEMAIIYKDGLLLLPGRRRESSWRWWRDIHQWKRAAAG